MPEWPTQLIQVLAVDACAVVISVISRSGSAPREIGTTMVLGKSVCLGTIGGGNLERTALAQAAAMLQPQGSDAGHCDFHTQTYALGPSLGQCCGGRIELYYQRVIQGAAWLPELTSSIERELSGVYLCRCLEDSVVRLVSSEHKDAHLKLPERQEIIVIKDEQQQRWICEPLNKTVPEVWLFGAGHVGQAVAGQLSLLPCKITWFDQREDWLNKSSVEGVKTVLTDAPEQEIGTAPDNTCFILMTHSHALDFEICHQVLRKGRFAWLGLIGSATKRQTFSKRLAHRGISAELIERLRCPVGGLSLQSSAPASVALSIAAELALLWEENDRGKHEQTV